MKAVAGGWAVEGRLQPPVLICSRRLGLWDSCIACHAHMNTTNLSNFQHSPHLHLSTASSSASPEYQALVHQRVAPSPRHPDPHKGPGSGCAGGIGPETDEIGTCTAQHSKATT
jgi:hypothetical protein